MSDDPVWNDLNIRASSEMEQAEMGVRNMTQLLTQFFQALLRAGMTRQEALALTCKFMETPLNVSDGKGNHAGD